MDEQPLETLIEQLFDDDDWLQRGLAVRRLMSHGEAVTPWLERVFELTFDSRAPVRTNSQALLKRLGSASVPFLFKRLAADDWAHREQAIWLLMESGCRQSTSTRMVEQVLSPRKLTLPDWGRLSGQVLERLRERLSDSDLHVRFAAASALEEFGQDLAAIVPVFITALQSGSDREQNWAALRLGRIGGPAVDAIEALRVAMGANNKYTRRASKNALARIVSPE